MLRRGLLIGGLGLSLTLAGAGVLNAIPAAGQESSAADTELTREERLAAWEEERQQRYEDFLAKFAANLGIDDPALVETAFKDTLKQLIDEELAAGDISANAAAEMKQRIDEAEGPFLFGGLRGGRGERVMIRGRHDRQFEHGPRGGVHRPGRMIGDLPVGGETIVLGPDDEAAGEIESLPASEEAESTPTN